MCNVLRNYIIETRIFVKKRDNTQNTVEGAKN